MVSRASFSSSSFSSWCLWFSNCFWLSARSFSSWWIILSSFCCSESMFIWIISMSLTICFCFNKALLWSFLITSRFFKAVSSDFIASSFIWSSSYIFFISSICVIISIWCWRLLLCSWCRSLIFSSKAKSSPVEACSKASFNAVMFSSTPFWYSHSSVLCWWRSLILPFKSALLLMATFSCIFLISAMRSSCILRFSWWLFSNEVNLSKNAAFSASCSFSFWSIWYIAFISSICLISSDWWSRLLLCSCVTSRIFSSKSMSHSGFMVSRASFSSSSFSSWCLWFSNCFWLSARSFSSWWIILSSFCCSESMFIWIISMSLTICFCFNKALLWSFLITSRFFKAVSSDFIASSFIWSSSYIFFISSICVIISIWCWRLLLCSWCRSLIFSSKAKSSPVEACSKASFNAVMFSSTPFWYSHSSVLCWWRSLILPFKSALLLMATFSCIFLISAMRFSCILRLSWWLFSNEVNFSNSASSFDCFSLFSCKSYFDFISSSCLISSVWFAMLFLCSEVNFFTFSSKSSS